MGSGFALHLHMCEDTRPAIGSPLACVHIHVQLTAGLRFKFKLRNISDFYELIFITHRHVCVKNKNVLLVNGL